MLSWEVTLSVVCIPSEKGSTLKEKKLIFMFLGGKVFPVRAQNLRQFTDRTGRQHKIWRQFTDRAGRRHKFYFRLSESYLKKDIISNMLKVNSMQ